MQNEKSQIYGQVFIYVLTIALTSFILIYGYNSIRNFKDRAEQVSCLKLKNDLSSAVDTISSEYGSVIRKDIQMCNSYSKICFVENFDIPVLPTNTDPIIKDSVSSGAEKNAFLLDSSVKDSFYIGKISVVPDVLCIKAVSGKVNLRLEGKGDHAQISEWS